MKYQKMLAIVAALAIILTACAPQAAAVPTKAIEPTMASTEATGAMPVTGEMTVNMSEAAEYGPILVDDQGLSLYVFMHDTQNSGKSTCTDADGCTKEWPPLLGQGSPVAGDGVDSSLLDTITRDDGTIQVTYNGWPLYHFDEDKTLGDTNGQGLNEFGGLWFLVSPAGEAIQE